MAKALIFFLDLEHSFRAGHRSLEGKRKIFTKNENGRQKVDLYKNMNSTELVKKCLGHDLELLKKLTKKELFPILKEFLRGTYRVPVPFHGDEFVPLTDTMLSNFEVLSVEPLHDLKEHIKNLLVQLPFILDETEKKNNTIKISTRV